MRILKETLQDVSDYLRSSELKEELIDEIPEVVDYPASFEIEITRLVVELVEERFPDEPLPEVTEVTAIKVSGDETEALVNDHLVVEFNGTFYDYTAHQFSEEFSGLSFSNIPVTQPVITNELQLSRGVSSVRSYALLKEW